MTENYICHALYGFFWGGGGVGWGWGGGGGGEGGERKGQK